MRVLLPAEGGHGLDGKDRNAVREDRQPVVLGLGIKDLPAGKRDDAGGEAVVLLEVLGGVEDDGDLGTGRDKGDLGILVLEENVASLGSLLDGGALELGKVLAGESNDGGSLLGDEGNVVGGRGLVAVGGTPDLEVWSGAEVGEGLDRLVGGAVLTEANGVVGSNPDVADVGEGRETDGAGGVGNEVEEGTAVGDDGAVGRETVHDGTHGVLADTIADVGSSPVTETSRWGLEVNHALCAGKVGAGQIGGTTDELGEDVEDLCEDNLGELAGGDGGVSGGIDGEVLLPALGKLAIETAGKISTLLGVLLLVLGELLSPLLLESSTLDSLLVVEVIDLLGDLKAGLGVETPLLLDGLGVVSLEGVAVDTVSALELGAVADGGGELDDGRLVLDALRDLNSLLDTLEVVVTVLDPLGVPAVGLEALHDILSEGAVGVSVNAYLYQHLCRPLLQYSKTH